ncbi:MAG: magnesium transporter [Oscillospiraceae bacterium]|nr:magnesium transporter [Oscillospiraceae bacterium]
MDFEELILDDLPERVRKLLEERQFRELQDALSLLEPQDVALVTEQLEEREVLLLFRLLPREMAAKVFIEMSSDYQEALIGMFSDTKLREVLDELYIDDTVDLIEEMPASVVKRILRNTDSESRAAINEILRYPKDSAGSIMTTEYVRLDKDLSVSDAFARIRRVGVDKETIYTCYVTEPDRLLIGLVTVRDLLLAEEDTLIGDIMNTNVIYVDTAEDKEIVAQTMSKYDFLAIPVVDRGGRLVGIVTYDDAADVIRDEATEDIEKMAAIVPTDKPYLKTGVFETWRKRIPWLLLLLVSATFTGKILGHYEESLGMVPILTIFIPMLMDTGGNAGSQASVTVIRGLSLGELRTSDVLRVVWKELRVALLCGISLAAVGFLKALFIDQADPLTAAVVSITLALTVFVAKLVGSCLPLLAKRLGFDPAVMASPFITTIVDALSLLVYFAVASALLPALSA